MYIYPQESSLCSYEDIWNDLTFRSLTIQNIEDELRKKLSGIVQKLKSGTLVQEIRLDPGRKGPKKIGFHSHLCIISYSFVWNTIWNISKIFTIFQEFPYGPKFEVKISTFYDRTLQFKMKLVPAPSSLNCLTSWREMLYIMMLK